MRFGLFYELQLPRPWGEGDELRLFQQSLDEVELADRLGFDNVLLPSGYALGIDGITFAGGIAPQLTRSKLLVAVRCGEQWPEIWLR